MTSFLKLKQFLIEKANLCLHEPQGKLKYPFVTPSFGVIAGADDNALVPERSSVGHYLQMYDWDACFFSQAANKANIQGLAIATVGNFLGLQTVDGYIPRTISPERIWDGDDLAKPFLAQTLAYNLKVSGDEQKKVIDKYILQLTNYLEYFEKHRLGKYGLYHWRNVLESGVDNNLALLRPKEASKDENQISGNFPDGELLAADLNGYLYAEFMAFSQLAQVAQKNDLAEKYKKRALELASNIDKFLWNDELGLYCNLDPKTEEQIKIRSWTGLVPALYSVGAKEKIEQVIERNILAEDHFLRPAGLSSMSASGLIYNQSKRGLYGSILVSNWQGPVWVLPNVMAVRCLLAQNLAKEAESLASRILTTMTNCLAQTGTLFENYDAETGKPLWAPNFMSWNILALELIELLD